MKVKDGRSMPASGLVWNVGYVATLIIAPLEHIDLFLSFYKWSLVEQTPILPRFENTRLVTIRFHTAGHVVKLTATVWHVAKAS